MKDIFKETDDTSASQLERLTERGLSRRDFTKFCTGVAVTLGLPLGMAEKIAAAATNPKRPPVFWLSAQECTGCTEILLRANHPTLDKLILELLSLDYHEALMAGAGHQAEEARIKSMNDNKGKYILVVEGSIPVKDGGIYCKIGGTTAVSLLEEMGSQAAAVIAIGSCASWGGIPSADPNPTGAMPAHQILKNKGITIPVVNIPGCPPNPYNFLSTVLYFLTFKKLPELDEQARPKFAYGLLIHENCERRPHFDAGRFAVQFGDEGHRKGYCLYKLGCKGPETHANCPIQLFNDVGSGAWPVGTGAPCFGCTEEGVGFTIPLHTPAKLKDITPPVQFPDIAEDRGKGKGVTIAVAAVAAGIAGAAIGAGAVAARKLGTKEENKSNSESREQAMDIKRRDFLKIAAGSGLLLAAGESPVDARPSKIMPPQAVGILYDSAICIGCKVCQHVCKEHNKMPAEHTFRPPEMTDRLWDNPIGLSNKTLNIIKAYKQGTGETRNSETDGFAFIKRHCMHCIDPACVSACPVSALKKDPLNGVVSYHQNACIDCRYCKIACPFNIPKFESNKAFPQIRKCQFCDHRFAEGKYSACCEFCPTGASIFGSAKDLLEEARKRLALKPGEYYEYPVATVGLKFKLNQKAPVYVNHIYGEKEGGGTQYFMLSGVPFDKLGLPVLSEISDAYRTECCKMIMSYLTAK